MKLYILDYYDPGLGAMRSFHPSKEARRLYRELELDRDGCGGYEYRTLDLGDTPESAARRLNRLSPIYAEAR